MNGPRGGIIDWTKPEQVIAYRREWRIEHRDELNARRRAKRAERRKEKRNVPAGDGQITVDLNKRDSWKQKAYSTEDWLLHDELGMGYDEMNKYRRMKEYE